MSVDVNPLIPKEGTVSIRLFGQGLGDCFLLAFPPKDKAEPPCYMLIDSGVARSTPDGVKRMKSVIAAIRDATNGVLDVLAITHQHYDHISSFLQAQEEWNQIQVKALYLPWTEATNERDEAKSVKKLRDVLNRAAQKVVRTAALQGWDEFYGLRAEASFLGIDETALAAGDSYGEMDEAMQFARDLCPDNIHFFNPGDVFRLPRTDYHGYVLGPPLPSVVNDKGKPYIELLVDEAEMYHYHDFPGMHADGESARNRRGSTSLSLDYQGLEALASAFLASDSMTDEVQRGDDDRFSPFAPSARMEWGDSMTLEFFKEHYGAAKEEGFNGAWRRIDNDWLSGAAELALRAGNFTNNVSLVLAFDIPDSEKMLLFPGDAQVGNWLSWHKIEKWNFIGDADPKSPPQKKQGKTLMEDLLARVAFYKVGHHGSHNATVKQQGLELMNHPELMAYIPVLVGVAQDVMGYCPMPFYPVVRRLQEKTKGRTFLANGRAVHTLLEMVDEKNLQGRNVKISKKRLGPISKDGIIYEENTPLYVEVTMKQ